MDLKIEQLSNGIMVLVTTEQGIETLVFNDADDAGHWFRSNFKFGFQPEMKLDLKVHASAPAWNLYLSGVTVENVIRNIKLVRELTGMGLKESKDLVDKSRANGPTMFMQGVSHEQATAIITRFADEAHSLVQAS
jgi:hypothetical protein